MMEEREECDDEAYALRRRREHDEIAAEPHDLDDEAWFTNEGDDTDA